MKKSLCCFNILENNKKICWAITNNCNYACNYCFSGSRCDKNVMSLNTIKRAINNIIAENIDYVILSGGEPLLCSRIYYIIKELTKNQIRISMCTNASLANDKVCKKLFLCGLRRVTVSFDYLDQNEFNKVKGISTAYYDSIKGIKSFISNGFDVTLNTVLQRKDISYIKDIVSFWNQNGIKKFSFSIPVCKNIDSYYSEEQIQSIERYLSELENESDIDITFCNPQCNNSACASCKAIFGMHTNGVVDKCLVKEFK